jgi:hypothetical protein
MVSGCKTFIESVGQTIDLFNRVVMNHRDAQNTTVAGEVEILDQPARMEVAKADRHLVGINAFDKLRRILPVDRKGNRRNS